MAGGQGGPMGAAAAIGGGGPHPSQQGGYYMYPPMPMSPYHGGGMADPHKRLSCQYNPHRFQTAILVHIGRIKGC